MKNSEVRYLPTSFDDYLELRCSDSIIRGVMFTDATAAAGATRPGRAELDCWAIEQGFLPTGASLVSSPGVDESNFDGDEAAIQQARVTAAAAGYVTRGSDRAARLRSPEAASLYDASTCISGAARN